MVKTLLTAVRAARVQIAEAAGASCVVYGLAQWSGVAALVATGVALLGKSLEWDISARADRDGDR